MQTNIYFVNSLIDCITEFKIQEQTLICVLKLVTSCINCYHSGINSIPLVDSEGMHYVHGKALKIYSI